MKPHRIATSSLGLLGVALLVSASLGGQARAATQVPRDPAASRITLDVWTNKEEGGVYRPGEGMRIFFRASADAYVLLYNIDTEGYIHLIYPYGLDDPSRAEGGRTYQIPSRRDPYDLVADGPAGVEYIVAAAAPFQFSDLPWYLTGRIGDGEPPVDDAENAEDAGVIVGDPYVGMDRILRRIVPDGHEDEVATADTYFYIDRRVEYPRYVCADCHYHPVYFDPYRDVCPVVTIRIDATWARYAPLRARILRPRYYYTVRSTAPDRYRRIKQRWSTIDGRTTLRERFRVAAPTKDGTRRDRLQQRTPPEFRDLRRYRPGRFWQGHDQVLKRQEQRQRERADQRRQQAEAQRRSATEQQRREAPPRDEARQRNDQKQPKDDKAKVRERDRPSDSGARDRGRSPNRDSGRNDRPNHDRQGNGGRDRNRGR